VNEVGRQIVAYDRGGRETLSDIAEIDLQRMEKASVARARCAASL
jgi:hypothetical protein